METVSLAELPGRLPTGGVGYLIAAGKALPAAVEKQNRVFAFGFDPGWSEHASFKPSIHGIDNWRAEKLVIKPDMVVLGDAPVGAEKTLAAAKLVVRLA